MALALVVGCAVSGAVALAGLFLEGPRFVCALQILCTKTLEDVVGVPQQIHVSLSPESETALTISWAAPEGLDDTHVELRAKGGAEPWVALPASASERARNGILRVPETFHHAIAADLQSDKQYEYRVTGRTWNGRPTASPIFDITLPRHTGPVQLRFAFIADIGLRGRPDGLAEAGAALEEYVSSDRVDLILGGGDYAYAAWDGRFAFPQDAIDAWFRQWQPLLARIPFEPAWGNHECCIREGLDLWRPRFRLPSTRADDGLSYSFDVGGIHFVSLFATGDYRRPVAHATEKWLESDLAQARSRGAKRLVVYQHEPIFATGVNHPARPQALAELVPILERYKVDLHLSAHDQSYERTYPLRDASVGQPMVGSRDASLYEGWQGVIYAKVSPAGKRSEQNDSFSSLPSDRQPFMAVTDDTAYHYAVVSVGSDTSLDYVAYSMSLEGERTVLDHFLLRDPSVEKASPLASN